MSDDQLPIGGQLDNDGTVTNNLTNTDSTLADSASLGIPVESPVPSTLEVSEAIKIPGQMDQEPDDIFGTIDSLKVEEKKTSPSQSVADAQAAANPVPTKSKLNFIIKLLLGLFLLGALVVGVILAYPYVKGKFFNNTDENVVETDVETENTEVFYNFPAEEEEVEYLETETEMVEESEPVEGENSDSDLMVEDNVPLEDLLNTLDEEANLTEGEEEPVDLNKDTDNDGLTDEEEKKLGTHIMKIDSDNDGLSDRDEVMIHKTNPVEFDSDGDGLSDYDEINVYKSDPLNSDSDGDTYLDGVEVSGGYNPNGPGKLEN